MPSLVVNPAGRVEDILGNCKVGHAVMLRGQPDGRGIKGDWGALASAEEFTLETEGHISHPGFLPERLSGRDIQSLPDGGHLCWEVRRDGGKEGDSFSPECGVSGPERLPLTPQHLDNDSCLQSLF